jgi:hypothetical protein
MRPIGSPAPFALVAQNGRTGSPDNQGMPNTRANKNPLPVQSKETSEDETYDSPDSQTFQGKTGCSLNIAVSINPERFH